MGYINQWDLNQATWADLGTAMTKNLIYNTIGPFPHDVLALPTTTGFMIDFYVSKLLDFLAADFMESLYWESLIERLEDDDYDEGDFGFIDHDNDPGEFN